MSGNSALKLNPTTPAIVIFSLSLFSSLSTTPTYFCTCRPTRLTFVSPTVHFGKPSDCLRTSHNVLIGTPNGGTYHNPLRLAVRQFSGACASLSFLAYTGTDGHPYPQAYVFLARKYLSASTSFFSQKRTPFLDVPGRTLLELSARPMEPKRFSMASPRSLRRLLRRRQRFRRVPNRRTVRRTSERSSVSV